MADVAQLHMSNDIDFEWRQECTRDTVDAARYDYSTTCAGFYAMMHEPNEVRSFSTWHKTNGTHTLQ